MSRGHTVLLLLAVLLGLSCADITDKWYGQLGVGANVMRLYLQIDERASTTYMLSYDQERTAVFASSVNMADTEVLIEFKQVNATYYGKLAQDDKTLTGVLLQNGGQLELNLSRCPAGSPCMPDQGVFDAEVARRFAGIPGLSHGVRVGAGKETTMGAAGHRSNAFADAEAEGAVEKSDLFMLGGMTRTYTALLFGRLATLGTLSLSDTLGQHFSAVAPDMLPVYRDAPIGAFLGHVTGMPLVIPARDIDTFAFKRTDAATTIAERARYARIALSQAPESPAPAAGSYSAYVVLASLLEAKLGLPFERIFNNYVLVPLGLKEQAAFECPGTPEADAPAVTPRTVTQPVGHWRSNAAQVPVLPNAGVVCDLPYVFAPASGLAMTPNAATALLSMLFDPTIAFSKDVRSQLIRPWGADAGEWPYTTASLYRTFEHGLLVAAGSASSLWSTVALLDINGYSKAPIVALVSANAAQSEAAVQEAATNLYIQTWLKYNNAAATNNSEAVEGGADCAGMDEAATAADTSATAGLRARLGRMVPLATDAAPAAKLTVAAVQAMPTVSFAHMPKVEPLKLL